MTDCMVLLDKPEGVTSFSALNQVKKTIEKKCGHAGTLDRFASGLLIVLCGKNTKKFDDFMKFDKTYLAKFEFGKETSTLDPEGEVTRTSEIIPQLAEIEQVIKEKFCGSILQSPPLFSAVHVNGKRAYELALKKEDFKLEKRPVNIYEFEVIDYNAGILSAKLRVSKGCYIRSIAKDLGDALGSCACLKSLRRTTIGPYDVKDAVNPFDKEALEKIKENPADQYPFQL